MVTNYDLTLLNFRDLLRKFYLLLEIIDFVSANVIMPCTIKWASVYSFLKHSCSNVLVYTFIQELYIWCHDFYNKYTYR